MPYTPAGLARVALVANDNVRRSPFFGPRWNEPVSGGFAL
jgi:hypothetical protein